MLLVHEAELIIENGGIAEFNTKEAVAGDSGVYGVIWLVLIFDVGADFLDDHNVEDNFDEGEKDEEGHEVPQQVKISGYSSSVILEIFNDVPAGPFAVF